VTEECEATNPLLLSCFVKKCTSLRSAQPSFLAPITILTTKFFAQVVFKSLNSLSLNTHFEYIDDRTSSKINCDLASMLRDFLTSYLAASFSLNPSHSTTLLTDLIVSPSLHLSLVQILLEAFINQVSERSERAKECEAPC